MLERLDKIAPYMVMLTFGYITYTTVTVKGPRSAQAKQPPVIGENMLSPVLAEPQAGASPVGRDPFEVEWASYLTAPRPTRRPTPRPTPRPIARPTTAPATKPAEPVLPPLPIRLTAVITGEGYQMAIIDDRLYKPGALIGGTDPRLCWRVEAIERGRVTLRIGEARRALTISKKVPAESMPPEIR